MLKSWRHLWKKHATSLGKTLSGNNHIVLYLHETSELNNYQSITFCESTSSITADQVNFQNDCVLKSEVKNKQHKRTKSHVLLSCNNKRVGGWVFSSAKETKCWKFDGLSGVT